MISKFKESSRRDSAVVYGTVYDQAKSLYEMDAALGGEFAMSVLELVMTGQISSDDKMISIMLKPTEYMSKKNAAAYDEKKEKAREKKKQDQQLEMIARLYKEGLSQHMIGQRIGATQQTVGNRLKLIKREYPELLIEEKIVDEAFNTSVQESQVEERAPFRF